MISSDIQKYIDLRIEEFKLKSAGALSSIVSYILTAIITVIISAAILVFLAVLLMQWLSKPDVLGQPWGVVIAGALLVSVIIIICCNRNRLFKKHFDKAFAKSLSIKSNDIKADLGRVRHDIEMNKASSSLNLSHISHRVSNVLSVFTIFRMVARVLIRK